MSLPPGPRAPAIWQALSYTRRPLEYLRKCGAKWGDAFTLDLGMGKMAMFSSPKLIKELFTAPGDTLQAGKPNTDVFGVFTGFKTLFALDETPHLERRRLMLPPFHGERMQEYTEVMRAVAERAIDRWPEGKPFAAHPETQRITLEVIIRNVLGVDPADQPELVARLTRLVNDAVSSPLVLIQGLRWNLGPWSPWGRVLKLVREADELIYAEIARRRAAPTNGSDILSILLECKDERGAGLTDEELRDELVTMLVAGHETTGTSLAWAIECVLAHPAVRAKLEDELRRLAPDGVDRTNLPKLEYLDAVVRESLRFRPIMGFGGARHLAKPFRIGDWELPAGSFAVNCLSLLHRRPELYPEPDEFRPERFFGERVDPYQWAPFGGGVRRCIGMAFALHEMRVVLATVVARAQLELTAPSRAVPRGFFVAPEGGLPVVLRERRASGKAAA